MPHPAPARVRPMGANLPRLPAEATMIPASSAGTIMTASTLAGGGAHYNSPWLRAAMLTPSVSGYMTVSKAGGSDNARALEPLLAEAVNGAGDDVLRRPA